MDFPLLTVIAGLFLLQRLSLYRSLRRWVEPVVGLVLIYRLFTVSNGQIDLLRQLLNEIEQMGRSRAMLNKGFFLGRDVLGMLLIFRIVRGLHDALGAARRFKGIVELFKTIAQFGYGFVKELSFVQELLRKEEAKLEQSLEAELKQKSRALGKANTELPETGMAPEAILSLMRDATAVEDVVWEGGNVSGAVYHGQRAHIELLNKAFNYYSISNPLHPDIWPSVMKFDSEVIAMTAALVTDKSDMCKDVCGSTTSGGTESIILAIKAHRDYYYEHFHISKPEMVVAVSAHAAVDKACDLMKIKLIKVDLDPLTFRANLRSMESAITPNTIMMYASAPSYPHGAIDSVKDLSRIALKYGIGLHVDCCLGGFVLPFAKQLSSCKSIPDFDFTLPGVTSMSLDTHKYGYALKGTSVVLYRSKALRHSQYFCYADWTGGMYTTPTIAGSRSGGLIAQCWASMMSLGKHTYQQHTADIFRTADAIAKGVRTVGGVKVLGEVDAMIVCFASSDASVNIYSVGDAMHKKGWSLNTLQHPPCLHICCTVTHVGREERFVADLRAAVEEVRANPNPKAGNAAIYGMTSSLPPGPVNELLKVYNDVVLKM